MQRRILVLGLVTLGLVSFGTRADGGVANTGPENSATSVATARYRSVFAEYRSQQDTPLESWLAANERVARDGGHAGHMGGTPETAPDRTNEPQPRSEATPSTDAHDKHKRPSVLSR